MNKLSPEVKVERMANKAAMAEVRHIFRMNRSNFEIECKLRQIVPMSFLLWLTFHKHYSQDRYSRHQPERSV